ncbi:MAG: 3-dehydroquinate synthase [Eubacteriales bacterium]|nr:3-dehydroquinate synthase [Eubacteriales bacterium]
MMELRIKISDKTCPIFITDNFSELPGRLAAYRKPRKVAVITDNNVDGLYAGDLAELLINSGFSVSRHVLPAGENYKNLKTIENIYMFLVQNRFARDSAIISLGGGVTGDMAGFAASTYMRGIGYIQVPTTLLAQADSSVGGKTGVDFMGSKNVIGSFYQPDFVYMNVNTLKTLPDREIKAGLAEVIKHGMIADRTFFDYININMESILCRDTETLIHLAYRNCGIKGGVVEKDEKEKGLREILNLGHTIGHALESAGKYTMLHGECVSVGIAGAFRLALSLGLTDKGEEDNARRILIRAGLPLTYEKLDPEDIYNAMLHDKKIKGEKITFVLPEKIGKVTRVESEDKELIMKVLKELKNK